MDPQINKPLSPEQQSPQVQIPNTQVIQSTPSQTLPPTSIPPLPPLTTNSPHSKKWILIIGLLLICLVIILGIIVIKINAPNLFSISQLLTQKKPVNTPEPSSLPSPSPETINNPVTREALNNAYKVNDFIDWDDPNILTGGLLFAYRGLVTKLDFDQKGNHQITTQKSVAGLPNEWEFNSTTKTTRAPRFTVISDNELKVGDKVLLGSFFTIKGNDLEPANQFNLITVAIMPQNTNLSLPESTSPPSSDNRSILKNPQSIIVTDPLIKEALVNAKKTMSNIDWNDPTLDAAGVQFTMKGNITAISRESDKKGKITIDNQIKGFPNTWDFDDKTFMFQSSDSKTIDSSKLKVGDEVLLTILFTIQHGDFTPANQFSLTTIILTQ